MVLPGYKSWWKARKASHLGVNSSRSLPVSPSPSSASSKIVTCSICLESMNHGHALFTAECSHSFHFSCIASCVLHGNLVCPVCRAAWTEVPLNCREMFKGNPNPSEGSSKSTSTSTSCSTLSDSYCTPFLATDSSRADVVGRNNGLHHNLPLPEAFQIRDAEEEQRLLEPVLRMLDETIATFRNSAAEQQGRKSSCTGRDVGSRPELSDMFNDDEALDPSNTAEASAAVTRHGNEAMVINAIVAAEDRSEEVREERFSILIQMKALGAGKINQRRVNVDLVAVLDVSGSMAGPKLGLMKQAMRLLVRSLGQGDRLSVVAFSSKARRVMPLKRMTLEGRRAAMEAVESLVSQGGSSIADGLCKGLQVLRQRRERNPVAAVMLLSDGQDSFTMQSPTAPLADLRRACAGSRSSPNVEEEAEAEAEACGGYCRNNEIFPVHTFGLGMDHDASTLHAIAEESGRTFSFIQGEGHDVQDAFAQCLGGLFSVVAQRVEVAVQLATTEAMTAPAELKGVEAGSYSCKTILQGRHVEIHLGDLYADEERDMLASVCVPVKEQSNNCGTITTLLNVEARYVDPLSGASLRMPVAPVAVNHPPEAIDSSGTSSMVNHVVLIDQHRNRLRGSKAIAEARSLADSGDFVAAQRCLDLARQQLQSSIAFALGDSASKALDTELGCIHGHMKNRHVYHQTMGRAYALSAQSSYLRQRAAMRASPMWSPSAKCSGGGSNGGPPRAYCTPSMTSMLQFSRNFSCSPATPSSVSSSG